jgi:hypothetical protein
MAAASTQDKCGADTGGALGCGNGPCGAGNLTAVYTLPQPWSLGIAYAGCRKGYSAFETVDTPDINTAAAAVGGGRRSLSTRTVDLSSRLKKASSSLRINAALKPGATAASRAGGRGGAFEQCVVACRGYAHVATVYNTKNSVLRCTCGFRLKQFEASPAGRGAVVADENCENDTPTECDYGPCGTAGGAEAVYSLPGRTLFLVSLLSRLSRSTIFHLWLGEAGVKGAEGEGRGRSPSFPL